MLIFKRMIAWFGLVMIGVVGGSGLLSAQMISSGDAAVSGFSGTTTQGGQPVIDTNGTSLKVFNLNDLGPAQAQLVTPPVKLEVAAKDIGQVFGIALDSANPPNIYVTATSAYGLHIVIPDNNGDGIPEAVKTGQATATFMEGQFGPSGNGGSVWKIDGKTGQATLFANLQNNGVDNGGAGLGNIVFDPTYYQLFVSDLDSGLIHRLDMNGNYIDAFDHGVQGRPVQGQAVVNDDGTVADITNAAFDVDNANTWGLTDIRRRVWGMAFYEGRLYYAVGDGPQIWSVGFEDNGSFAADARIEISAIPGGFPVSDILFTEKGRMVLAQRGNLLGASDFLKFHTAATNSVLRYAKDANGQWIAQPDEYAIGFPPDHKNTSGGIATSCDNILWSTGDNLRNDPVLSGNGEQIVHGLQGNDLSVVRPRNVPPWSSWYVDYDGLFGDDQKAGHVGDVEIFRQCRDRKGDIDWDDSWPGWIPPDPEWTPPPTWVPPPWWLPDPDLELIKDDTQCTADPANPGAFLCTYTITISNVGAATFNGPLTVVDNVPADVAFVPPPGGSIPWNCAQPGGAGTAIDCQSVNPQTLPPGTSETLDITVRLLPTFVGGPAENCAFVDQPGDNPANNDDCGWGYPPGPDLEILKTLNFCFPVAGGMECRYWIDVNNVGNAPYNGTLHITENVPAGATYLGVVNSSSPNWTCMNFGGSVNCWFWPAANLPAFTGNEWVEIAIFIPNGAPAGQQNCAELNPAGHPLDPNINGNNTDCAPVPAVAPMTMPMPQTVNNCPPGWSLQQTGWAPPQGLQPVGGQIGNIVLPQGQPAVWETITIGQGAKAITCGRLKPQPKPVCPQGWTEYPSQGAVPKGWQVKMVGSGNSAIVCAKPPVVVPPPVGIIPTPSPSCRLGEQRFIYRSDIPKGWNYRRVKQYGKTIWCAKPVHTVKWPTCYANETRFFSKYKVPRGWSVRRVTRYGKTIWCAKPRHIEPPVTKWPHCYRGETRFLNKYKVPRGWSVRRVTQYGKTIWCARPGHIEHICQHGYHWNGNRCIPNIIEKTCRHGYHWSSRYHRCIPNIIEKTCQHGYHWNGNRCIPNIIEKTCRHGYHWSSRYHRCIPNKKVIRCKHGYHWNGHRCVPNKKVIRCKAGYRWNGHRCVPKIVTVKCRVGYYWNSKLHRCVKGHYH